MIIKLVRHGESEFNVTGVNGVDHEIPLTNLGLWQSRQAGRIVGASFLSKALIYTSPYLRAKQTTAGIIDGSDVVKFFGGIYKIYQDPRIRESEFGFGEKDIDVQEELRKTYGYFYYRFRGGESPADVYDRVSSFIDSMMRQIERKRHFRNVLIVSHGITIRCFVKRFMHLTTEQYNNMRNPGNCDVITISPSYLLSKPQFTSGKWGIYGLKFYKEDHQLV